MVLWALVNASQMLTLYPEALEVPGLTGAPTALLCYGGDFGDWEVLIPCGV